MTRKIKIDIPISSSNDRPKLKKFNLEEYHFVSFLTTSNISQHAIESEVQIDKEILVKTVHFDFIAE